MLYCLKIQMLKALYIANLAGTQRDIKMALNGPEKLVPKFFKTYV